MKIRLTVVALALVALTGCSPSASEPTATPTPTPTVSSEAVFLKEMRATEAFFGFPDEQLIRIGNSVCEALRDGSTFDDLVSTLAITDYTKDEASSIIFASAKAYCPEQER